MGHKGGMNDCQLGEESQRQNNLARIQSSLWPAAQQEYENAKGEGKVDWQECVYLKYSEATFRKMSIFNFVFFPMIFDLSAPVIELIEKD